MSGNLNYLAKENTRLNLFRVTFSVVHYLEKTIGISGEMVDEVVIPYRLMMGYHSS